MSKKPTLKELEQKIAELTEALLRERADAMNVRRRTEDDKAKLGDFYKVMILRDLLPALDNLDRALQHLPKELETKWDLADEPKEWVKGIKNVDKQFQQCFEKLGIERIKTVGEPFDPKLHEAISVEGEGSGVEIVCEELQPGYRIGDDIIRHALVKVKVEKK